MIKQLNVCFSAVMSPPNAKINLIDVVFLADVIMCNPQRDEGECWREVVSVELAWLLLDSQISVPLPDSTSALSRAVPACLNTGQSHLEKACEIQHARRNMQALYSHPDWLFLHRLALLPHTLRVWVLRTNREQRSSRLKLSCHAKLFKTQRMYY